jgi:HK97 gp10 family phage protein
MSGRFTINAQVAGLEPLMRKLQYLKTASANRVMRKSILAGTKIVLKAAKSKVHVSPREGGGILRKSLGRKVKTYRGRNVTVGIVGPRHGFESDVQMADGSVEHRDPTKYSHLVEYGRDGVRVQKKRVLSDGTTFFSDEVRPVKAMPFMRPAWSESRAAAKAVMMKVMQEELLREAVRGNSK